MRLAWSEDVWCLAVDHVAARSELLLRHSKGDAQDVFDEEEDEGCPDRVPANDEEEADNSAFIVSREKGEPGHLAIWERQTQRRQKLTGARLAFHFHQSHRRDW